MDRVIAYASKTLIKSQRNYSTTKRDFFEIVHSTNHFQTSLLGRNFVFVTDHRALVWLYSFEDTEGMIARWLEKSGQFDFEIKHKAGKDMRTVYKEFNLKKTTQQLLLLHEHLKKTFLINQRTLGCHFRTRTAEIFRGSCKRIKIWQKSSHASKINSDLTDGACPVRLKNYGRIGSISRILVSWMEVFLGKKLEMSGTGVAESQIPHILPFLHESMCTGHLGIEKTNHRAQERFCCPSMKGDVEEWVNS